MRGAPETYDALARLLAYPTEGFAARVAADVAAIARDVPEAGDELVPFALFVASHELGDCEEAYVSTFDVNAERALEVGWQVFGEQYARGAFLVRMREMLRQCGVAESYELPDHMTHVLRVLPRIETAQSQALVESALVPALRRILGDAKGKDGPYSGVLRAVARIVAPDDAAFAGTTNLEAIHE